MFFTKQDYNEEKKPPAPCYKSPLPKKKQRVQARAERNGKCRSYTEEEIFLYKLRLVAKKGITYDT